MGIEFMSVLKPGPVYVGTLLSEQGEDVRKVVVIDTVDKKRHEVLYDDWQAVLPVYILSKEVKSCDTNVCNDGHRNRCKCLVIRI